MVDVTDRKMAEIELEETQTRLATILNNLPNVIFYESEHDRIFISDNVNNILGYTAEEIENNKVTFYSIIHPDDINRMELGEDIWNRVMNEKYFKQQFRAKKKNGEYIWLEDHMYAAKTSEKDYIVGFMMDISERKITQHRLEETQMRLAAVLNNLPNVVFYENAFGKQFISENIMEMLGYPVEDFYRNANLFDSLIQTEDLKKVINQTDNWFNRGAKGTYREVFRIKRKDGSFIWLEDHMFKSQRHDGKNYYSGVMIDITERKNFEEQLARSLKEKELLIKEIHHRVKNNLQVISSLLKLQSTYIKDNEALDMLVDSQNRVQSMALVHQKLYQSKDLANIDLNEYLQQLLYHLLNSIKSVDGKVKLNVNVEDIKMGVDTAIPCGLIINELVSNSLKHAFPGDKAGIIDVELKVKDKDTYEMKIKDNGKGFADNIDFKNTSTLGLQLVNTLVSQLEGNIEIAKGSGTEFSITFKDIG
jgi:PAS domain S-box-containing protein